VILYETHVKGLTMRHPDVPPALRGTFAGVASEPIVRHLTELGVDAVELLPVHQFVDDRHLQDRGLHNYWGYNTIGFFAPDVRYRSGDELAAEVRQFKEMVRTLHRAGIEVILDVVYNHTAEGNHHGPTFSFRGIDNPTYYRLVPDAPRFYYDYTGTGNTLNVRHPQTLQLIMDSLRYWVLEMHVDGFRFDLAAALARGLYDVDQLSSFFTIIHQDPVLSQVKLIAEPWDLGAGGYQVGNFPVRWAEWNGRYRDTMRAFWRGDGGVVGELGHRLSGSSDLYESDGRRPYSSINFITCHDGFTLADLVAYDHKHNEANGEGNRDGAEDNLSWNCGVEGPTDDPEVLALRRRQQRNLLATLLLSQGTPMLGGGDEIGRTQGGNNNAYCQDNPISWYDWQLGDEQRALLAFTRKLIRTYRAHPALQRAKFFKGRRIRGADVHDILWFRPDGALMSDDDWQSTATRSLAMFLAGEGVDDVDDDERPIRDDDLMLVLNAGAAPVEFVLPAFPRGTFAWEVVIDTGDDDAHGVLAGGEATLVPPRTLKLLRGVAVDAAFPSLGALVGADGVGFRVWASGVAEAAVVLYERGPDGPVEVARHGLDDRGGGLFEATVPGLAPGALYRFRVGAQELPDPYARRLPFGVHGPAEVVAPARVEPGEWRPRPLSGCAIYELHIGTFTPEGTFAAATARLAELADLGVTAIELLPVSSFSGARGWGYDGVAHFAPHAAYGSPDELRALVAEAHRLGMNALLDVVYNHFGPEGNYLGSYSPGYFARDIVTPWGQGLNFSAPATRRFVLDNALYWLDEFGFDGLRLDATHAIHDRSERTILQELAAEVRARGRGELLIAEDETNHPDLVLATGLDALWADDFHHILHTILTGERDSYYEEYPPSLAALARCIERGFLYEGEIWRPNGRPRGGPSDRLPASAFVLCLQNHDQVGNRAFGERLHHIASLADYAAASMLLLFLPMTPLLWMGQEWAASSPWQYFTDHPPALGELVTAGRRAEFSGFPAFRDEARREAIPDPQAESTFLASKLRWDERERPPHADVLALYRALLRLRRDDPVLARADRRHLSVETDGAHLRVRRWTDAGERLLVVDFSPEAAAPDPRAPEPRWSLVLDSGGPGLPPPRAALYAAGPPP
jgi:glycogen operon protein